jgi:alcohol dehydrogenase class IV
MKRRGLQKINQKKMSNNNNVSFSDENFIKVMINQFNKWTNQKRKNVLIVKTNELFETSIVNKLESFLKKKIHHFPIKHVQPKTKTNIKDVEKYKKLFKKFQAELDFIDTYCAAG